MRELIVSKVSLGKVSCGVLRKNTISFSSIFFQPPPSSKKKSNTATHFRKFSLSLACSSLSPHLFISSSLSRAAKEEEEDKDEEEKDGNENFENRRREEERV